MRLRTRKRRNVKKSKSQNDTIWTFSIRSRRVVAFWFLSCVVPASLVLFVLPGCGSRRASLPSSVIVELPDGTTAEVDQGAGAASLANSKWQFFRTAGSAQGLSFVTIVFGPEGNLESFENNTIASEILGTTIIFDGQLHSASQQGLQYAASTYGAETADGTGFTFEGRMTAFAAGIRAGEATANATGTFDPDDPDTMTGTFSFSMRVTLLSIPEANQDDEFSFIAHRVQEE